MGVKFGTQGVLIPHTPGAFELLVFKGICGHLVYLSQIGL